MFNWISVFFGGRRCLVKGMGNGWETRTHPTVFRAHSLLCVLDSLFIMVFLTICGAGYQTMVQHNKDKYFCPCTVSGLSAF